MKIAVLFENTLSNKTNTPKLKNGHGLSLYIETKEHKILFDMGQNDDFAYNAESLGIDLSLVDIAILSHGHYDHGGGIEKFLNINNKANIYINKNSFGNFYSGYEKYIGLDRKLINNPRFVMTEDLYNIDKDLYLTTIGKETLTYPMQNQNMLIKSEHSYLPDLFNHEQYLIITENGKKTVISGCSHKGILNIISPIDPHTVIGGFHISKIPTDINGTAILEKMAHELLKNTTVFYTCHCTGIQQYDTMKRIMKNKLFYISTGDIFII